MIPEKQDGWCFALYSLASEFPHHYLCHFLLVTNLISCFPWKRTPEDLRRQWALGTIHCHGLNHSDLSKTQLPNNQDILLRTLLLLLNLLLAPKQPLVIPPLCLQTLQLSGWLIVLSSWAALRNTRINYCGSLNVVGPYNLTGSGTGGKCGFVGVGMVLLQIVCHCGGGFWGLCLSFA